MWPRSAGRATGGSLSINAWLSESLSVGTRVPLLGVDVVYAGYVVRRVVGGIVVVRVK
jgi:hypothetical protein